MFSWRRSGRSARPSGSARRMERGTAPDRLVITPLPVTPKWPASTGRASTALYDEPPLRLRSMPQPTAQERRTRARRTPRRRPRCRPPPLRRCSAAASSVQRSAAAEAAPRRRRRARSRNASSSKPWVLRWRAIASASTTSVPGSGATWRSARAAMAVRRGSTTVRRAPAGASLLHERREVGVRHGRVGAPHHDMGGMDDVERVGRQHASEDLVPRLARPWPRRWSPAPRPRPGGGTAGRSGPPLASTPAEEL